MMTSTSRDVISIPRIGHDEAMAITEVENRKFDELLHGLKADDWAQPTECTRWDVRAMAAHLVGSAASQISPREFVRQVRKGRPLVAEIGGEAWWDGMNEVQVRERAHLTTAELMAEWEANAEAALRSRRKLPRPVARLPLLKLPPPIGRQPIAYLFDIGFTRDVWAHRIDICVAIGQKPDFDEAHDGRIVADIVAEWAGYHGEPFTLELSGPAGGTFVSGSGDPPVSIETVEFIRILAGRTTGEGVLRHGLPL